MPINFCVLPAPKYAILLEADLTSAKAYAPITMFIDSDAYSAYRATAIVIRERLRRMRPSGGFADDNDKEADITNKVRGIKGELAILSALNQFRIPYNFDHQLLYMPEHKLGPDFILYPSGKTVEIKTQASDSDAMLLNVKQWRKLKRIPDVVIALKESERSDYAVEAKGWLDGKKVTDGRIGGKWPAYVWSYDKINDIKDIAAFLRSLSRNGFANESA